MAYVHIISVKHRSGSAFVKECTAMQTPSQQSSSFGNGTDNAQFSESKIRAISSLLNLCERATINMQREGVSNAIKAIIIVCMKFVDKESLFKSVLPDVYMDWDYVRMQTGGSSGGSGASQSVASRSASLLKKNLLGDGTTWLHLMQFLDFGEPKMPDRLLQKQYPPLYCMHSAVMSAGTS